jgi:chromosome segregation ATPase
LQARSRKSDEELAALRDENRKLESFRQRNFTRLQYARTKAQSEQHAQMRADAATRGDIEAVRRQLAEKNSEIVRLTNALEFESRDKRQLEARLRKSRTGLHASLDNSLDQH